MMTEYIHVETNAVTGEVTQRPMTQEEIDALINAPTPVPASISDRQFFQQLAVMGAITRDEAKDAVRTGAIPASMQAVIDGIADEDERFAAEMLVSGAVQYRRDHPLVAVFAAAMGWSMDQVDNLFRDGAKL